MSFRITKCAICCLLQHGGVRQHLAVLADSLPGSCVVSSVAESHEPTIVRSKRHLCSLAPAADVSEAAACLGQEVRAHACKAQLLLCHWRRCQLDMYQAAITIAWHWLLRQASSLPGPCSNLWCNTGLSMALPFIAMILCMGDNAPQDNTGSSKKIRGGTYLVS